MDTDNKGTCSNHCNHCPSLQSRKMQRTNKRNTITIMQKLGLLVRSCRRYCWWVWASRTRRRFSRPAGLRWTASLGDGKAAEQVLDQPCQRRSTTTDDRRTCIACCRQVRYPGRCRSDDAAPACRWNLPATSETSACTRVNTASYRSTLVDHSGHQTVHVKMVLHFKPIIWTDNPVCKTTAPNALWNAKNTERGLPPGTA